MPEKIITVSPQGELTFIYDDKLRGLLTQGEARVSRASHVEPGDPTKGQDPLKWYADLAPVGGPVLEGCDTRESALQLEVAWLNKNNLGRKQG